MEIATPRTHLIEAPTTTAGTRACKPGRDVPKVSTVTPKHRTKITVVISVKATRSSTSKRGSSSVVRTDEAPLLALHPSIRTTSKAATLTVIHMGTVSTVTPPATEKAAHPSRQNAAPVIAPASEEVAPVGRTYARPPKISTHGAAVTTSAARKLGFPNTVALFRTAKKPSTRRA